LDVSCEGSTQALAHAVVPPGHGEHVPATHTVPGPQAWPQAPQLAGSEAVATQALPHRVCAAGHAQCPAEQISVERHAWPQAPQLAGSEEVSLQALAHTVLPPGHGEHVPAAHTVPGPHA
jgi:hypothetical protein